MKHTYNPDKIQHILVEVDLTGAGADNYGEFILGSVPQLRDAQAIIGIEAFNATQQTKGPTGKTNAPDATYKTSYLTITDGSNTDRIVKMPLSKLIRSTGGVLLEKFDLARIKDRSAIDPQRSKVTIGDQATLGGASILLLEFTYVNQ